jgi:hypothetical protein
MRRCRSFSAGWVNTLTRGAAQEHSVPEMNDEPSTCHVEAHLTTTPPVTRLLRAAGVSEVVVSGTVLTCLVSGSFQPLLECLRGYEVVRLWSTAADASASPNIGETRRTNHAPVGSEASSVLARQGVDDPSLSE